MHVRSDCSCVMVARNILITALIKIITVTPRERRVRTSGVLFIQLSHSFDVGLRARVHVLLASRHVTDACVNVTSQRDLREVIIFRIFRISM